MGLIGGAETYAVSLAKEVADLGHSVSLITASKAGNGHFQYDKNLKITGLKTDPLTSFGGKDPFSTQIIPHIVKEHFDVIHLHQIFNGFTVASTLASKLMRIPIFATDHGGGALFYRALSQVCANMPDAFITVSESSLRYLKGLAPRKRAFVAYGGVNTRAFHPDYDVSALRRSLNLDNYKVVLCVGRLLSCKGFDVAIKAMRNLPRDTKLVIVGPVFDPEYYRYLLQLGQGLGERLQFIGHVSDDDLPKYYNLCDVFVRSSVNLDCFGHYYNFPELLGLVKLEAMACGKPVVVSDVGGLGELVQNGKNGFVYHGGDDLALAKALEVILSDDVLREKMGHNGLEMVRERFSWRVVASKVVEFYNNSSST